MDQETFEDTKGVIRRRKWTDKQNNDQKNKRTNNDLQNITQKTHDRATRTSLKNCTWRVRLY
jgi:hypothetical protein